MLDLRGVVVLDKCLNAYFRVFTLMTQSTDKVVITLFPADLRRASLEPVPTLDIQHPKWLALGNWGRRIDEATKISLGEVVVFTTFGILAGHNLKSKAEH